jgi:hypothetical protein
MLNVPRRVPVCVFERSPRGIFQSELRLIFLGRLLVLPVLFVGAAGYFAYLADHDRLRSIVFSELQRIMSSAGVGSTYCVEGWFMDRDRLCVEVTKRTRQIRRTQDHPAGLRSWLERIFKES